MKTTIYSIGIISNKVMACFPQSFDIWAQTDSLDRARKLKKELSETNPLYRFTIQKITTTVEYFN